MNQFRRSGASALALLVVWTLAGCGKDEKVPVATTSAGEASTVDWTMLGYDLSSTYWNQAETKISTSSAPNLQMAWEFNTKASVTGTPVISGGRAYVTSSPMDPEDPTKGGLIAIELATGREVWRSLTAAAISSLALDGDVLYMHDRGGVVRAFDVKDGRQLWELEPDDNAHISGFSSPVVTKDFVLVGGASGEEIVVMAGTTATFRGFVAAVNKADGTLAWKKSTVEPPHTGVGIWSTLSVDEADGVVFAATGNNYTGEPTDTSDAYLALPLADGARFLWKQQILAGDVYTVYQSNGNPDADFGANPVLFEVEGRKLAAGGNKGGDVWVVDRSDGTIIKVRKLSEPNAFKGGIFISGAWDGKSLLVAVNGATSVGEGSEEGPPETATTLFALNPLTLEINWERQVTGHVYSPISVANGVGFVGKDKTLQAFDTATGRVLMEFPTEATIATAPAVSDGYVVFGSGMQWIQATNGTKYYALKVP